MSETQRGLSRRRFIQTGAALGGVLMMPGLASSVWAAGSDQPERQQVNVGFIPLTDCAPLVMASV